MDSKWFTTFSFANDARLRLFCFHYAGGSSNIFRSWQSHMPSDVEVVGVELPGHGKRLTESCHTDLPDLVENVGAEIHNYLDVPFAFFGHSMGALISFELARLLRKYALPQPRHLFLSAHKAPHMPRESDPIHALPDFQFVKRLVELNGTPKAVMENEELRALFLPLLRADFKVCETYRFKNSLPLNIPMTVFGGRNDEEVGLASLRAWEEHTTGPFYVQLCEGDHFFINAAEKSLLPYLVPQLKSIVSKDEAQFVSY